MQRVGILPTLYQHTYQHATTHYHIPEVTAPRVLGMRVEYGSMSTISSLHLSLTDDRHHSHHDAIAVLDQQPVPHAAARRAADSREERSAARVAHEHPREDVPDREPAA